MYTSAVLPQGFLNKDITIMEDKINNAIKRALALTVVSSIMLSAASAATTKQTISDHQAGQEKCYGIVKAGMNDCQTSNQSCAGSAVKDSQGDAFLFLPKGLCNKIVNGSLKAKS